MLMGFISFLLTVGQKPISKICIPKGIAYSMLPCKKEEMAPGSDHCSKEVNTKLYRSHIHQSVIEIFNAIRGCLDRVSTDFDINSRYL